MAPSRRVSLNPQWPHYAAVGSLLLALALGLLRYFLLDFSDPNHCKALVTEGKWLGQGFQNWQPNGCMMHKYTEKDSARCLASRRVVFIGDSITRQLFFTTAHMADKSLPSTLVDDNKKHQDHTYTSHAGTEFSFVWDPFLNGTRTKHILASNDLSRVSNSKPALLVLGTGLWYLRHSESSGGSTAWESTVEKTLASITSSMPDLADDVVFLPVEEPVFAKLTSERSASIHAADVDAMNSDLFHRINPRSSMLFDDFSPYSRPHPNIPIWLPLTFNRMLDESQTEDGLHFSSIILQAQANVLLNLRCNDILPKRFPLSKTCCSRYPNPSLLQLLVLLTILFLGPLAKFGPSRLNPRFARLLPGEAVALPLTIFGLAIALVYLADRTGFWLKEQKQFDPWIFGAMCVLSLAVGLLTVKKSDKDLGLLNREQTDEWKGWMQVAILIYHYFGASKVSGIYNPIRVLVASYLFMTGYGHTTFYLKKADFGFLRIAQVLVRLNLLTVVLAYTMNTDYISYYFAPLVSLWFLIIYATMYAGHAYNDRTLFLVVKLFLSMALVTTVMSEPRILETLFELLAQIFAIKWSAKEWSFRVKLDLWIVYAGMFSALAYIKFRESRVADHPRWQLVQRISIAISALVLVWFFAFELMQESKFTYNLWHPYISFLPVCAFVVLRNASVILRSASSRAFAFIGTCSLETFILQYHIWLAGDTKGILLVFPGTRWRPFNMVVTTFVFIWVSHKVAVATGDLTSWICGTQKKTLPTTVPSTSQSSRPTSAPVNEEAIALVPASSGDHSHLSKEQSEGSMHPEQGTSATPELRWMDRLASGPQSVNGLFGAGFWTNPSYVLAVKFGCAFGVMWVLNVLWPQ